MKTPTHLPWRILVCLLGLAIASVSTAAPFIDPADDEKYLGSTDNVLEWTPEQQVAGFRNSHRLTWTRNIEAGDSPLTLPYDKAALDDLKLSVDGESMTVSEYFDKQSVAGLLVIQDGSIKYERYGLGNTEDTRWVSFSVSKSVVSLLFGAAIHDGYIKSTDEKVTDYLPRLKNSSYDESSIANLLQMASGVQWNENYADPESDVATVSWETLKLYEQLRNNARVARPGYVFNYNTAETNLAGTLLRAAVGNNLSTYLSEKIWKPFGMEADAVWNLTEPGGGEFGGCCISATFAIMGASVYLRWRTVNWRMARLYCRRIGCKRRSHRPKAIRDMAISGGCTTTVRLAPAVYSGKASTLIPLPTL